MVREAVDRPKGRAWVQDWPKVSSEVVRKGVRTESTTKLQQKYSQASIVQPSAEEKWTIKHKKQCVRLMAISCFSFPYLRAIMGRKWLLFYIELMEPAVRSIAHTREQPHTRYLTFWRAGSPSMDWWWAPNNWKWKWMKINRFHNLKVDNICLLWQIFNFRLFIATSVFVMF